MNTKVKEIHPVDDKRATDDTTKIKLMTEDQVKTFRQELDKLISDVYLGKTNSHQANSTFRDWQGILVDEVAKLDNTVITGLFELQADLVRAIHQH